MITRVGEPRGWSRRNLNGVPPVHGVYVLRDQHQNILFIGSVNSRGLRERLMGHLREHDIPGVKYFEWYQTDGVGSAREKERYWTARYKPPFGQRWGLGATRSRCSAERAVRRMKLEALHVPPYVIEMAGRTGKWYRVSATFDRSGGPTSSQRRRTA